MHSVTFLELSFFFLAVVQDKFESYFGMSTAVGLNGLCRGCHASNIEETIGSSTFGVLGKGSCFLMLLMTALFLCRLWKQYQLASFSLLVLTSMQSHLRGMIVYFFSGFEIA